MQYLECKLNFLRLGRFRMEDAECMNKFTELNDPILFVIENFEDLGKGSAKRCEKRVCVTQQLTDTMSI